MVPTTLEQPLVDPATAVITRPAETRTDGSWTPDANPQFTVAVPAHDLAAGDPSSAGAPEYPVLHRDPVRVAAIWISVVVVATAAYSLIFGATV
jgi:hypothetical protein